VLSDRAASTIIYLVAAIWGANMIIAMIPGSGYKPSPEIHGIFTVIVGGAFAARARNDKPGGDHRR
jgi:hypothetical protein